MFYARLEERGDLRKQVRRGELKLDPECMVIRTDA